MGLMDTLKAKAKEAQATDTATPKLNEASVTQATGMASQVSSADTVQEKRPVAELNSDLAANAIAVFEDIRPIRQIFPTSGKLKAIDGFFYPSKELEVAALKEFEAKRYVKQVK